MIDIASIEYDVELMTKEGNRFLLNKALINLDWEDYEGDFAQRANITLANFQAGNTYLISLCALNSPIFIYAKWNGGERQRIFEGNIWDWEYTSSTQKEFSIMAYDPLIRLTRNKVCKHFSSGMKTEDIIKIICEEWKIPFVYKWCQIEHAQRTFRNERIGDIIYTVLNQVKERTGKNFVLSYREGNMEILDQGSNKDVYYFPAGSVISTENRLTMDGLITKVLVIGKEDENDHTPVTAVVDNQSDLGVWQDILIRDSARTIEEAKQEAEVYMSQYEKPKETISIKVPDIPFIRKGDKIRVEAGNIIGYFYIKSIIHDATKRTMSLYLDRVVDKKENINSNENEKENELGTEKIVTKYIEDLFGTGREAILKVPKKDENGKEVYEEFLCIRTSLDESYVTSGIGDVVIVEDGVLEALGIKKEGGYYMEAEGGIYPIDIVWDNESRIKLYPLLLSLAPIWFREKYEII